MAHGDIRAARLVRQVVLEIRAGFRDRAKLMIAHGSPPSGRHLQYEAVACTSTDEPFDGPPSGVAHSRSWPLRLPATD